MQKLHFETFIQASREKVWETMLEPKTYTKWTSIFNVGSKYEGGWNTGDDIRFIGPEEDGTVSGMIGKIKESRKPEFVSIQYTGEINKNVEKKYEGEVFENYTFIEKDGGTQLLIDLDSEDAYAPMFQDLWPKSLVLLKNLAEGNENQAS